jgi:CTP synthase (UTP-ammonia lyase)
MKMFIVKQGEKSDVKINGIQKRVDLALDVDAVYYQDSYKDLCRQEPSFKMVKLSKYQSFIDAYKAVIKAEEDEANREPTQKELDAIEVQELRSYLSSTDFKFQTDYDQEPTQELIEKRQLARDRIRELED